MSEANGNRPRRRWGGRSRRPGRGCRAPCRRSAGRSVRWPSSRCCRGARRRHLRPAHLRLGDVGGAGRPEDVREKSSPPRLVASASPLPTRCGAGAGLALGDADGGARADDPAPLMLLPFHGNRDETVTPRRSAEMARRGAQLASGRALRASGRGRSRSPREVVMRAVFGPVRTAASIACASAGAPDRADERPRQRRPAGGRLPLAVRSRRYREAMERSKKPSWRSPPPPDGRRGGPRGRRLDAGGGALRDGSPMSEKDLRDELLTLPRKRPDLLLAGLGLRALLRHPESWRGCARRRRRERTVYMDAVVKETLRLCPPVAVGRGAC